MEKHFKLTEETKVNLMGVTLFRIISTRKSEYVEEGIKGGWVESEKNISGNAWVSGDAQVSGNAEVYGDARVSGDNDYCCFQNFGSENRTTTFMRTKDKSVIQVKCGCFLGTLTEFAEQVKKTHGEEKFAKEYLAIIEVVKIKFEL